MLYHIQKYKWFRVKEISSLHAVDNQISDKDFIEDLREDFYRAKDKLLKAMLITGKEFIPPPTHRGLRKCTFYWAVSEGEHLYNEALSDYLRKASYIIVEENKEAKKKVLTEEEIIKNMVKNAKRTIKKKLLLSRDTEVVKWLKEIESNKSSINDSDSDIEPVYFTTKKCNAEPCTKETTMICITCNNIFCEQDGNIHTFKPDHHVKNVKDYHLESTKSTKSKNHELVHEDPVPEVQEVIETKCYHNQMQTLQEYKCKDFNVFKCSNCDKFMCEKHKLQHLRCWNDKSSTSAHSTKTNQEEVKIQVKTEKELEDSLLKLLET